MVHDRAYYHLHFYPLEIFSIHSETLLALLVTWKLNSLATFAIMPSSPIRNLIINVDLDGLKKILSSNPSLANEEMPFDKNNAALEHPLHRICDGVFGGKYTDHDGAKMAAIFLAHGAMVNGNELTEKKDTPLIAACSLRADALALLYIEAGADVHHQGCHGGTALHWAAWCGRDSVVERLLREDVTINKRCIDFQGTPLLWAIHGYRFGGKENRHRQVACTKLLLEAGADKTIPNHEGYRPMDLLEGPEPELKALLA